MKTGEQVDYFGAFLERAEVRSEQDAGAEHFGEFSSSPQMTPPRQVSPLLSSVPSSLPQSHSGDSATQNHAPVQHSVAPLVAQLALSPDVMRLRGFPQANTAPSRFPPQPPRIFALCVPIVNTTQPDGSIIREPALLILVDETGRLAMNIAIRPRGIPTALAIDGVTPQMLTSSDIDVNDARELLASTVKQTDILVGHQLHRDLYSLQYAHPLVVDTAQLHPPKGPRQSSSRMEHIQALENSVLDAPSLAMVKAAEASVGIAKQMVRFAAVAVRVAVCTAEWMEKLRSGSLQAPNTLPHVAHVSKSKTSAEPTKQLAEDDKKTGTSHYKTLPCLFFARGWCFRGEKCTYIHDKSISNANAKDLWTQYRERLKRQGSYRSLPCKHYLKHGHCFKQEMCTFRHAGEEEEEEEMRQYEMQKQGLFPSPSQVLAPLPIHRYQQQEAHVHTGQEPEWMSYYKDYSKKTQEQRHSLTQVQRPLHSSPPRTNNNVATLTAHPIYTPPGLPLFSIKEEQDTRHSSQVASWHPSANMGVKHAAVGDVDTTKRGSHIGA